MLVLSAVSFVAGVVTVLSPCVLPILPVVLAAAAGGRRRPLAVILGLVASFAAFTLLVSQLIVRLGLPANLLRLAAVAVIGLLGLAMVVPSLAARLERLLSRLPALAPQMGADEGWRAGLLTGATLGLVWAPCAGPILAAVTTLAATQRLTAAAGAMAVFYSVGAGIPLLVIAYGGRVVMTRVPHLARRSLALQKAFGALMIVTAFLIAFNIDVSLSAQAATLLPSGWTARLSALEGEAALTSQPVDARNTPATPAPGAQPAPPAFTASLPVLGKAPELEGIDHWINSPPLTLAGLRGKVVLIDFWTYSCINCIRTLPYVTQWWEKYRDQGLVIIGVHSPEFAFERDTANVVRATKMYKITYPVAQDNSYGTWSAFNNLYWPAKYIIDAQGNIRYTHFGEGEYSQTEKVIQDLLAEAGHPAPADVPLSAAPPVSREQSPETYVGMARPGQFVSARDILPGKPKSYTAPVAIPLHAFAVSGLWQFDDEYGTELEAGARLIFHFRARDVYLVMTSDQPVGLTVTVDKGRTNHSEDVDGAGRLMVTEARLYHLLSLDAVTEATVTLTFDEPGVRAYAFTFGS